VFLTYFDSCGVTNFDQELRFGFVANFGSFVTVTLIQIETSFKSALFW